MPAITLTEGATWIIAAVTTGGVIARPWRLPEAIWAALGGTCLVAFSLVPWRGALQAIGRGTDVYLFLAGMMLLAELARQEGLFEWLAAGAASHADGSGERLFALVFVVGTLVTVLLSNDATAVVLTPAVYAVARTAKAEPLPFLFICAFIANAASFALPISNPANLVVYGRHMPALSMWLAHFAAPSVVAIGATYIALRLTQRRFLRQPVAREVERLSLTRAARLSGIGIVVTAIILLSASAFGRPLGLPTFVAGAMTAGIVLLRERRPPWKLLRHVSWSVLPLVAGLFVLVEGLARTGVIERRGHFLQVSAAASAPATGAGAGLSVALACNLMNNLPAGLIAGSAIAATALPAQVAGALLIGVDLGPNLSVTGSLATILWLVALRREGQDISAWRFLRVGAVVTLPALILALGALLIGSRL
jgi:arsenical pump membrane protein